MVEQKGGQIVQSLEEYRHADGYYPKRLADLTPKHMKEIPSVGLGLGPWEYTRFETEGHSGFALRIRKDEPRPNHGFYCIRQQKGFVGKRYIERWIWDNSLFGELSDPYN